MTGPTLKCNAILYFENKYTLKLIITFEMAYLCCFSNGGNLEIQILSKKLYNTNYKSASGIQN